MKMSFVPRKSMELKQTDAHFVNGIFSHEICVFSDPSYTSWTKKNESKIRYKKALGCNSHDLIMPLFDYVIVRTA